MKRKSQRFWEYGWGEDGDPVRVEEVRLSPEAQAAYDRMYRKHVLQPTNLTELLPFTETER